MGSEFFAIPEPSQRVRPEDGIDNDLVVGGRPDDRLREESGIHKLAS
jgi:hypothetical protein